MAALNLKNILTRLGESFDEIATICLSQSPAEEWLILLLEVFGVPNNVLQANEEQLRQVSTTLRDLKGRINEFIKDDKKSRSGDISTHWDLFEKLSEELAKLNRITVEVSGEIYQVGTILLNHFLTNHLYKHQEELFRVLEAIGIIRRIDIVPGGSVFFKFELNRVLLAFSDPLALLQLVYKDEKNSLLTSRILNYLEQALIAIDVDCTKTELDNEAFLALKGVETKGEHDLEYPSEILRVYLFEEENEMVDSSFYLDIIPSSSENNAIFDSIAIIPSFSSSVGTNFLLTENWEAGIITTSDVSPNFYVTLGPRNVGLLPLEVGDNTFRTEISFSILAKKNSTKNAVHDEEGVSTFLEKVEVGFSAISDKKIDVFFESTINLLINLKKNKEKDGFIQKILPTNGIYTSLDITIGWSYINGLYFKGSGGLETSIPIHKKIGPIHLRTLYLQIALSIEEYLHIRSGISLQVKLGPISATIDRVGLGFSIAQKENGNLGFADFQGPSFLPPTGAGLAIQAGVINGGGYLDFDPDNERYAGMLALKLGSFDLTAIGLITTRMPDGSKGFSLLVSIGVVFMPPIQLSYGFTLSGVGGLLGVNRRMVVEKIQDGLSEGSIDSIMFPVNAIENADRIISDLRAIFPPAEGQFVIAPFVKIGWGTPNIIQVDLGIFLEFPFKGRIILIGKLAAILPKPEKAILQLQVDVFGNFDFANERILILGALRDSYLYEYPLSGEFGFLLSWGKEKAFLLSAGGFHPRYQPPAGFPALKPIRLDISKGKFHIAASCYHAITANSFQFGARAELLADYDSVNITGVLSFDTFIQFQPFGFTADMGLKVDVRFKGHKLAGADMNLALSGPSPWVASGTATFSIWIWDKDMDFYESWGGEPTGAIEAIKAWEDRLKPALESNESWGFYLPTGTTQLALLKPLTEDKEQDTIYLPPNASLEIRQQALPLEADLEQLGNAPIAGSNRFAISGITIGGVEVDMKNTESVKEHFARGQFFKLSDSEKLSTPAFDPMKAGVGIKPPTSNIVGEATNYEPGYENILIGDNLLAERDGHGTATDRNNTQIRRALHRKKWRNLPVGERMKQSLQAEGFGHQVQKQAETSSVQADGELLATFETYTEAAQYVRAHSDGAGSFKIVRK